jgi:LacI family repressor for deo operon, udp, cdd, tsx, nupC, and nupG
LPTILDVAAAAGVSTATVSRVLSNPEKVTEATRRRVLKAVRQLGYSPNAAAKSLRTLSTRKLLVTVPDIANPFFSLIIQGIEEAAQREGYAVVLGDTHHDPVREERYGEMLLPGAHAAAGHNSDPSLAQTVVSGSRRIAPCDSSFPRTEAGFLSPT